MRQRAVLQEYYAVAVAYNRWESGIVALRYVEGDQRQLHDEAQKLADEYGTRWGEVLLIERVP